MEIVATRKKIQVLSDLIKALTPVKMAKEENKKNKVSLKKMLIAKLKDLAEDKKEKDAEW